MTMAELQPIFHGRNTIRLADGKFGLIIILRDAEAGIQVDGEEDIRWAPVESVIHIGNGEFVQGGKTVTLERRRLTMHCRSEYLKMIDAKARHYYFASKFDDYLRDQGMYRAGPVEIECESEQIAIENKDGVDRCHLHITVQITADSASTMRPSGKTKTPSRVRERLDSVG